MLYFVGLFMVGVRLTFLIYSVVTRKEGEKRHFRSRVTGEMFSEDYTLAWKKHPIQNFGTD